MLRNYLTCFRENVDSWRFIVRRFSGFEGLGCSSPGMNGRRVKWGKGMCRN